METEVKNWKKYAFLFISQQKLKMGKISRESIFFYFQLILTLSQADIAVKM